MAEFEVATVGDNCIDRYMPPIGLSTVGGNAVNVGVHLTRLGLRTGYFGAVGGDEAGLRMRACFTENGLDISRLQTRGRVTAWTDLDVDATGDRIIAFEEFGACKGYRPTEADMAVLCSMRHVHIGWLDDGGETRRRLLAAGVSVSQDLAVNPDPEGLTVAFASAGADMARADALLIDALARGARLAVVTCGKLGSIASDGVVRASTGIRQTSVVDTTGAGDTFIAGFLASRLAGHAVQSCLEAGRDAAAGTCSHLGGFPQAPEPF